MRLAIIPAALLLAGVISTPAAAMSGLELLSACLKTKDFANGFVVGVIEEKVLLKDTSAGRLCMPQGLTNGGIGDVVCLALIDQDLTKPAAALVAQNAIKAWPCP